MDLKGKKGRGLGLCSGGLDSRLAALVLRNQGIHVEWVTFETPFFSSKKARQASRALGIPITVEEITPVYLEMLKNPPCGYGKQMNPCMDCHALMFKLAGGMMQQRGFDFLFSGEVLGQRPMSQTRPSLRYVEKHSGFSGRILRPLSAKRLDETIAEKEGLVDREGLLDIAGRSRKRQIALAEQFGITDYPAPAGGCLLTDKGYSRRLKDLFGHGDPCTENALYLLKYGRHFRLDSSTKLIVGRTKNDNEKIIRRHDPATDMIIRVNRFPGPIALVPNHFQSNHTEWAASICAGYSKAPQHAPVEVIVTTADGNEILTVVPVAPSDVRQSMV